MCVRYCIRDKQYAKKRRSGVGNGQCLTPIWSSLAKLGWCLGRDRSNSSKWCPHLLVKDDSRSRAFTAISLSVREKTRNKEHSDSQTGCFKGQHGTEESGEVSWEDGIGSRVHLPHGPQRTSERQGTERRTGCARVPSMTQVRRFSRWTRRTWGVVVLTVKVYYKKGHKEKSVNGKKKSPEEMTHKLPRVPPHGVIQPAQNPSSNKLRWPLSSVVYKGSSLETQNFHWGLIAQAPCAYHPSKSLTPRRKSGDINLIGQIMEFRLAHIY